MSSWCPSASGPACVSFIVVLDDSGPRPSRGPSGAMDVTTKASERKAAVIPNRREVQVVAAARWRGTLAGRRFMPDIGAHALDLPFPPRGVPALGRLHPVALRGAVQLR